MYDDKDDGDDDHHNGSDEGDDLGVNENGDEE